MRTLLLGFIVLVWWGCADDNPVAPAAPETHLSIERIDLSGPNRLNSSFRLSWYGTDRDGYVVGYEFTTDQVNWYFTTVRDSVFKFELDPGSDTTDIEFYIRALDNDGNKDETPAFLRIPLKNSPPVASFDVESFPADTTFGVCTFRWNYSDPDGDATVTAAFLKVNEGAWYELDRSARMVSLRSANPSVAGSGDADVFYNTSLRKEALPISGWNNGGSNTLYLKVVDLAGRESAIDTSSGFFNKRQTSDLLLINGQPPDVNARYRQTVKAVYPAGFDAVDFAQGNGRYQPIFWVPTFSLITELYDKLIFNTDQSLFANPLTGRSALLLEFAAPVMQNYTDGGGKSMVTTSFPPGFDPAEIRGAFPVDSLSLTSGQAVIEPDSFMYPVQGNYPKLQPTTLLLGADPFVPSIDSEPIYRAGLRAFGAWKGTDIVGAARKTDGKTRQVFFSVELYRFNKDESKLRELFDQILNKDFNW
ncbi:MAG: hypothetical protein H6606_10210 [Flavobacteriales bacterium]|nr:hypothetical protein [Flavobacteriales bacterium]